MEDETSQRKFNISCCRSYLTPKGRCYTCPELEEELENELGKQEKDPDEEEY
ncbi:MAG: hypothetical protein Q8R47_02270 [Nanoarchaeota archaeon]|nr:hypothetical protein [Nanoarchaeota archaeon]